jgi:hypothetical protein
MLNLVFNINKLHYIYNKIYNYAFFSKKFLEVIKDIIKNCSFETKKRDEIIIRQGDIGDW